MDLTIFNHHKEADPDFLKRNNLKIIFANNQDEFYQNLQEIFSHDYDYVLLDQNHDSFLTSIIYLLHKKNDIRFKCFSSPLSKAYIENLKGEGVKHLLSINSRNSYNSDFNEFETITLVNPHETGLSNISCCQILFNSLSERDDFSRDLTGIGIISDYTLEEGYEIIVDILKSYQDIFPELLKRVAEISLNKYNIHDSVFGELSRMFWAPCVLEEAQGVENLVQKITENPGFTYRDLLEGSKNPSVQFICEQWDKHKKILEKERNVFIKKRIEEGNFLIYEPEYKSENFVREFSNIIKDKNIDKIVIMKTDIGEGKTKYSIRRGELEVDLGAILRDLGMGGGNPFAAGCTVGKDENFEEKFIEAVNKVI